MVVQDGRAWHSAGHRHCVSYRIFMQLAFVGNRMCPHHGLPLCSGSDVNGVVIGMTESRMQQLCAEDAHCQGYSRQGGEMLPPIIPVSGWANHAPAIANWTSLQKQDLCSVPATEQAGSRRSLELVEAMRSWQDETLKRIVPMRTYALLQERRHNLIRFANSVLSPPRLASEDRRPVFYPFSGCDLFTAAALFPNASRYALLASLPFGDPHCFLESNCRRAAFILVREYLLAWRVHWCSSEARYRFATGTPHARVFSAQLNGTLQVPQVQLDGDDMDGAAA